MTDQERSRTFLGALGDHLHNRTATETVDILAAQFAAVRREERQAIVVSLGRLAARDWLAASARTALTVAAGLVERGEDR